MQLPYKNHVPVCYWGGEVWVVSVCVGVEMCVGDVNIQGSVCVCSTRT